MMNVGLGSVVCLEKLNTIPLFKRMSQERLIALAVDDTTTGNHLEDFRGIKALERSNLADPRYP
jgi:hypothetical protein